jgi:hypothetical protein
MAHSVPLRGSRHRSGVTELWTPTSHNFMKYITMIGVVAALLVGCGKKEDSIAKKVGEAIGQQATDFTTGVGKGIDQKMMVQVSLTPQIRALGLTNTIAKSLGLGSTNGISIYFIASQNVSNTLVARALNAEGVEVGRSRKLVVMQKDDATYITFNFDDQMDTAMVKRYEIGL